MDVRLVTWLKDGKHRLAVLKLLLYKGGLPSELASKLSINRASISRILRDLKKQGLIEEVSAGGRTKSILLKKKGKEAISTILKQDLQ